MDLRRTIEFKYALSKVLDGLPDTITGTLKGSIYAKADREDMDSALDFINAKVEDKIISEETGAELAKLLKKFCVYR